MKIIIYLFYYLFLIFILIILSPLFLIISICVIVSSGFPILYKQVRVGKRGKLFLMYKFRTMTTDADKKKLTLINKNEADGPVFKIRNDPRFTGVGKYLSHTGLDELPQVFNVLKNEMAFIGPRPLPVNEVVKLAKWQQRRNMIKPGIISPWILNGYHSQSFGKWMESDIKYSENKNIFNDTKLLINAAGLLFKLIYNETLGLKK